MPDTFSVATFSVATFNIHAGVDGWGRPFDVVEACRGIDADVLAIQEDWTPDTGPGLAERVAAALGYQAVVHRLAGGRLAGAHAEADDRWMRSMDWRGASHAIFSDSERPFSDKVLASPRYREAGPGHWGIALLSRIPLAGVEIVDLGRLARDRARRAAIVARLDTGVTVVATHMSHITYGAPVQFVRLRRRLSALVTGPAVLAGDMNLWGPPVAVLLPGWRRALAQPTWPAWRPHSHVDHLLVHGSLDVLDAAVLPMAGSDHRPVRARLGH